MIADARPTLVVIGNGMVGHKFLELLAGSGGSDRYRVVTFCEEPRLAYDRVHLSEWFGGATAEDLAMGREADYAAWNITVHVGEKAEAIDRQARMVRSSSGRMVAYDRLVLATGSYPFVPPVAGRERRGCFVYRTIADLEAIRDHAAGCRTGAVVGGGLLGLEAANALKSLGLDTHVVEFAPQLMGVQVDAAGGALLRGLIEELGVRVHTGMNTRAIEGPDDRVGRMAFADDSELQTDLVVFSAGIRPRDEIARACGLELGERGGIVIDDRCVTSDPAILAIGECALWNGRIFGLVAPGNHMARVAVDTLQDASEPTLFQGADMSTKLKLLGVDVASFGDSHGRTPGCRSIVISDEVGRTYKRIVISADGKHLLGGILVGDASDYDQLHAIMANAIALPERPEALILPTAEKPSLGGPASLPDEAQICSCNNVSKAALCAAVRDGCHELAPLKACTRAGTGCGGCVPMVQKLLEHELEAAGLAVDRSLCEHFAHTRQELYHIVRSTGIRTFPELLLQHGRGRGCEICKPAVASILASIHNECILEQEHAPLQDTNDRMLANMQRDGTYSVVPRVPGGEITPDQLIALGTVAKRYDLYTKITGGQRVDLFGARADQLPPIWEELIAAGFESGHAYGKSVRTVKTCVGSTWCRYGVQDAVGLGIRLENRYKGLRSPHKLKFAVSGCTRECAEAQGKDVGVIATESGYNLYVCGNGGMRPRHADLLATDLDEASLIRFIDRFLMFYIRTADRLQRTSVWFETLDGGIAYLRQVIIDDSLGLGFDLEAQMQQVVDSYRCEWREAVEDPAKRRFFTSFVNHEQQDAGLEYVRERDQRRPAHPHERRTALV